MRNQRILGLHMLVVGDQQIQSSILLAQSPRTLANTGAFRMTKYHKVVDSLVARILQVTQERPAPQSNCSTVEVPPHVPPQPLAAKALITNLAVAVLMNGCQPVRIQELNKLVDST